MVFDEVGTCPQVFGKVFEEVGTYPQIFGEVFEEVGTCPRIFGKVLEEVGTYSQILGEVLEEVGKYLRSQVFSIYIIGKVQFGRLCQPQGLDFGTSSEVAWAEFGVLNIPYY